MKVCGAAKSDQRSQLRRPAPVYSLDAIDGLELIAATATATATVNTMATANTGIVGVTGVVDVVTYRGMLQSFPNCKMICSDF